MRQNKNTPPKRGVIHALPWLAQPSDGTLRKALPRKAGHRIAQQRVRTIPILDAGTKQIIHTHPQTVSFGTHPHVLAM